MGPDPTREGAWVSACGGSSPAAYPPFKNGLPDYGKLQNVAAQKKFTSGFAA